MLSFTGYSPYVSVGLSNKVDLSCSCLCVCVYVCDENGSRHTMSNIIINVHYNDPSKDIYREMIVVVVATNIFDPFDPPDTKRR